MGMSSSNIVELNLSKPRNMLSKMLEAELVNKINKINVLCT